MRVDEARLGLIALLDAEITAAKLWKECPLLDHSRGAFCCAESQWSNQAVLAELAKHARKHGGSTDTLCISLCRIAAENHGLVKCPPLGDWSESVKLSDAQRLCVRRLAGFMGFLKEQNMKGDGRELTNEIWSNRSTRLHLEFACVLEKEGLISLPEYFIAVGSDDLFWDEVYQYISILMTTENDSELSALEEAFGGQVLAALVNASAQSSKVEESQPFYTLLQVVQTVLEWSIRSENTAEPRLLNPLKFRIEEKPFLNTVPEDAARIVFTKIIDDLLTRTSSGYKPPKLKTAVSTQRQHNYGSVPATYKETLFVILGAVGCQTAVSHLKEALMSEEVNWRSVFAFVICLLARFVYEARVALEAICSEILREGCDKRILDFKIAALLLARQLTTDFGPGATPYLHYDRWWKETFCRKESYVLRKGHLDDFREVLEKLAPFEPLEFLKVQAQNPPPLHGPARQSWIEYEQLAKTRIKDLAGTTATVMDTATAKKSKMEDPDAIARDVDAVAEDYVRKGEIPFTLVQMKVLRCHHFQFKFLPELLKPRILPNEPDDRMKLIEALVKNHHIKSDAYRKYKQDCDLANAGYLQEGAVDELMEQMNAQIDLDSLLKSLADFEVAFRSTADIGPRRDERVSNRLVEVGKILSKNMGRVASQSTSSYVEVELGEDLLGSNLSKRTEICITILDSVGRCLEYLRDRNQLETVMRKQPHLQALVTLLANDKSLSSVLHLMTLSCITSAEFPAILERFSAANKDIAPLALGFIEGWMRAVTDTLPSVKVIKKGPGGKETRIVDSLLDGLKVCLESAADLHVQRFLGVLEGCLIPQVPNPYQQASKKVLEAVPADVRPVAFFALDHGRDWVRPGLMTHLWEDLRDNSAVVLEDWLEVELGSLNPVGIDASSFSSGGILSKVILFSPEKNTRKGIQVTLASVCRRALKSGGTYPAEVVAAVNEAYLLGLASTSSSERETPLFVELWRRIADDCGSYCSQRVDNVMFDLWKALPVWVVMADAVQLRRGGVNLQSLVYLIQHNWVESFATKPGFLIRFPVMLKLLEAAAFISGEALTQLLKDCRCLVSSLMYHWDEMEPVLRNLAVRCSEVRSLVEDVASAKKGTLPEPFSSMDLSVVHLIHTLERSQSAMKLTVPWLNSAPEDFVSDIAISMVARITLFSEGEERGAVLSWLLSGDYTIRAKLSSKLIALCDAILVVFEANKVSNSWPSVKNFLPNCSMEEFLSDPQPDKISDASSFLFPLSAKAAFMLPFYKFAVLARFWSSYQQNRASQVSPKADFIRAWIVSRWEMMHNVERFFGKSVDVELNGVLPFSWLNRADRVSESFLETTDRMTWLRLRGLCYLLDGSLLGVARRKGAS